MVVEDTFEMSLPLTKNRCKLDLMDDISFINEDKLMKIYHL